MNKFDQKLSLDIPTMLHEGLFLFLIQVSSAFEFAHENGLTHGDFDLSQVISDVSFRDFQVINFRPWLVTSRKYGQLDAGAHPSPS